MENPKKITLRIEYKYLPPLEGVHGLLKEFCGMTCQEFHLSNFLGIKISATFLCQNK